MAPLETRLARLRIRVGYEQRPTTRLISVAVNRSGAGSIALAVCELVRPLGASGAGTSIGRTTTSTRWPICSFSASASSPCAFTPETGRSSYVAFSPDVPTAPGTPGWVGTACPIDDASVSLKVGVAVEAAMRHPVSR